MTSVALLVEEGATPSSVTATLDMFRLVGRFDPDDPVRVDVLSALGGSVRLAEGMVLETLPMPVLLSRYDAVVVPGFFAADLGDLVRQLESSWRPAIERLRALDESTLVGASCHGTFVLAESGLLDGRAATTSWWFRHEFAARYPVVRSQPARSLVEDGNRITAGAMMAHADLSLHLLRRLKGVAVARGVASIMLVDESRTSQSPFMALQRVFREPLVDAAVRWMDGRLERPFSAAALAEELHVSYRTLHRRFRTVTGMAPLAYLHALRVERAKELLEGGHRSVAQVGAAVGYGDEVSFRRIFTRLVELSPAQYRRRFQVRDDSEQRGRG